VLTVVYSGRRLGMITLVSFVLYPETNSTLNCCLKVYCLLIRRAHAEQAVNFTSQKPEAGVFSFVNTFIVGEVSLAL
jgi:hypothetical protein